MCVRISLPIDAVSNLLLLGVCQTAAWNGFLRGLPHSFATSLFTCSSIVGWGRYCCRSYRIPPLSSRC